MRDYPIEELLWGLAAGVAALAVALALATAASRPRSGGRLAPVVGLPISVAALVAIGPSGAPTPGVVVGLFGVTATVALAGAGRSAGRTPRLAGGGPRLALPLLVAAPFAWLLAVDASPIGWVRAVVVAGATVGPVMASRTDAGWGPTGLTPAFYAVSAAGVFAAVPNTKDAAALLGASVAGAVAAWPLGRARLGRAGAASATALMVWVAGVGSLGREPAIVGAVACLGLLTALPSGRWLADRAMSRHWPPHQLAGPLPALIAHTGLVAVTSRVAGTSANLSVAVPVATATLLVALALSAMLQRGPASATVSR